jgi:hypothetical protein
MPQAFREIRPHYEGFGDRRVAETPSPGGINCLFNAG